MNSHCLNKVCLLATDKSTCNPVYEDKVRKHIKRYGAWAAWWSFPIKDKSIPYLLNEPFYIYISEGKGIFSYRYTVVNFISSHGNKGCPSPWPKYTEKEEREKRVLWAPCKTWFLVTEFKEIPFKLLGDFVPIKGLSTEKTLICRSTFGYSFLRN